MTPPFFAMQGVEAEDQHAFTFPGIGTLYATKEMGTLLRIDFVPDPAHPAAAVWGSKPSLLATVALHHLDPTENRDDAKGYKEQAPLVLIEDGTNEDPAAYAYIQKPGNVRITFDGFEHSVSVVDGRPTLMEN